ncbi:fibrobacter succinogenes major paralogous domain-containing protein, partial [bacterium]|nr:fibrobacter succinogenes major paralogous domain-containing protein [bacterium]
GLSTGARCAYNNSESNASIYGYLYNWYAVNDSRNIAPPGWHVPTDEEWKALEKYLGISQSEADDTGGRGADEGSKLAGNAALWHDGSLESYGTFGESGFSGLPGGYRSQFNGSFFNLGYNAKFWSATEYVADYAWYRNLSWGYSGVYRDYDIGHYGLSVRLVRNDE